jgi:hypothetical protein
MGRFRAGRRVNHGDTAGTAKGKKLLTTTNTTGTTKNRILPFVVPAVSPWLENSVFLRGR